MNSLKNRGISSFKIQHAACRKLIESRHEIQPSSTKVYCFLAYMMAVNGSGYVHITGQVIQDACGLSPNTVIKARRELERIGLIKLELTHGHGGSYCHILLDIERGTPLDWNNAPWYFHFPHSFVISKYYPQLHGNSVLLYLLAMDCLERNQSDVTRFPFAYYVQQTTMSLENIKHALRPLKRFLRIRKKQLEILHPETGRRLEQASPVEDVPFYTGKVKGSTDDIFSTGNYQRFFTARLPGLDEHELGQQKTLCPFHDDHEPSLHVNLEDGIWHCHVCGKGPVGRGGMLGFEMKWLKTNDKAVAIRSVYNILGLKMRAAATSRHFYRDADGEITYEIRRFEGGGAKLLRKVGEKFFPGLGHVKKSIYSLPNVLAADVVIWVEGEKKADALSLLNLRDFTGKPVAVTTSGGASSWQPHFALHLLNKKIIILSDFDAPGQVHSQAVKNSLDAQCIENKLVPFTEDDKYDDDDKDFRTFLKPPHSIPDALLDHVCSPWLQEEEAQQPQAA